MGKPRKRKLGQVTLRFYEYPDQSIFVKVHAGKNDIPDKAKHPYDFNRMLILSGEVARYTQQQVSAMNTLLVSAKEFKIIQEAQEKKADVDRLQTKLPFEGDDGKKI